MTQGEYFHSAENTQCMSKDRLSDFSITTNKPVSRTLNITSTDRLDNPIVHRQRPNHSMSDYSFKSFNIYSDRLVDQASKCQVVIPPG
jgi:hypothetical protein